MGNKGAFIISAGMKDIGLSMYCTRARDPHLFPHFILYTAASIPAKGVTLGIENVFVETDHLWR
jgi:hypothetical protein